MKKSVLFLIFILQLTIVKGQQYFPFPDSGAIWNNAHFSYPQQDTMYSQFGIIGDTIFDLTPYHKLYLLNDTSLDPSNATYVGAFREESKKIFFRYNYCQHEILLYDFTKQVGDSIHSLFSEFEILSCDSITSYDGIIANIDSTLINGSYRKIYHIDPWYPDWIEGSGSLAGLLNPIPPQITGFDTWDLVCFKKNEDVLYMNPNYNTCFPLIVGINENNLTSNSVIKIYPNPVSDISTFEISGNEFKYLTFYNNFGQVLNRFEISNQKTIQLNKDDFNSGLILYKIETTGGQYMTGKIIIE